MFILDIYILAQFGLHAVCNPVSLHMIKKVLANATVD